MHPELQKIDSSDESREETPQKEARWEKWEKEIETMEDSKGREIGPNIKEAVIALNVLKINTSASCEGHVERGMTAPWIEVEAPNKPEKQFAGENEVFQKAAKKYGISFKDVRRAKNEQAQAEAVKKSTHSQADETPEYKKWREENEKLMRKTVVLLDEFYKKRNTPDNLRLAVHPRAGGFRVVGGGEDYQEAPNDLSDEEKHQLEKQLAGYREEMWQFADFLKRKHFKAEK
ncbi:MAG: hypothetical protein BMS9Abin13_258 [Patescibacteria group bacterium]|nr:MAG: hypothetical protein BMS9Abin13_258 [Patescibacteria group bacterium]